MVRSLFSFAGPKECDLPKGGITSLHGGNSFGPVPNSASSDSNGNRLHVNSGGSNGGGGGGGGLCEPHNIHQDQVNVAERPAVGSCPVVSIQVNNFSYSPLAYRQKWQTEEASNSLYPGPAERTGTVLLEDALSGHLHAGGDRHADRADRVACSGRWLCCFLFLFFLFWEGEQNAVCAICLELVVFCR